MENQVEKKESLPEDTLYSRPPFTHVYAGLAALAILLLFFARVFGSDMIYGSDILLEFFYNRAYGFGEMLKGNIPLWNPHQFCGYPFVGVYQSAIFYPLNIIFLVWSAEAAFTLSTILHMFLAWLGVYLYIFHLTRKTFPSFIAGLVYMMAAIITSRIYAGHITILCAYSWLPFIIFTLDKSFRNRSLVWACAGSLFFGIQILAGHPAMVYYSSLCVFIYSMGWLWCRVWEEKNIKAVFDSLWPGFVIGAGGALVAAVQLLPTYYLSQYSVRSAGVTYEFATSFSFPPENFITYIAPYFFGSMADSPYWGRWFLWEVLPYIGILPLVFLIMGAFRGKQAEGKMSSVGCRVDEKEEQTTSEREKPLPSPLATPALLVPSIPSGRHSQLERSESRLPLFMALLGLFAVLMALGGYAGYFKYVYKFVPGFSSFRGHGKILMLFAFAGAAGTGLMINSLLSEKEKLKHLLQKSWKVLAIIACIILLVLIISTESEGGRSLFWKVLVQNSINLGDRVSMHCNIKNMEFLEKSYSTARASLWIAFVMFALAAGLFKLFLTDFKHKKLILSVIIGVFIIADLFWASSRYIKGSSGNKFRFDKSVVNVLKKDSSIPVRIASSRETGDLSRGSLDNISHAGGYDPAQLRRYVEYCNTISDRDPNEQIVVSSPIRPGKMLKLMGVSHVIASFDKPPYPGSKKVLSAHHLGNVYKLNNPFPRAFVVHKVHVIPERLERLKKLKHINPLTEAVIEDNLESELKPLPKGKKDITEITEYTAHNVKIKVNAVSDGLLVLADTYYPAWKATVDGKPAEIIPTDHLFRGVAVPEGEHEVVFYYNKKMFHIGSLISLLSIVVMISIIIGNLMWVKHHSAECGMRNAE